MMTRLHIRYCLMLIIQTLYQYMCILVSCKSLDKNPAVNYFPVENAARVVRATGFVPSPKQPSCSAAFGDSDLYKCISTSYEFFRFSTLSIPCPLDCVN